MRPMEIRVPPLGESVVEATVGKWTKQEGEAVAKDEVLVELETDKITVEIAAQQAGVVSAISKKEGDTVGVGDVLGTLEAGAAEAAPKAEEKEPAASSSEPQGKGEGDAQTSPSVRRLAAEN